MSSATRRRSLSVVLPWLAAALVWLSVVAPMRADRDVLLRDQTRIRRERLRAETSARESTASEARIAAALEGACRASGDPASLRRRLVSLTDGLALSRVSLSVAGSSQGASIEAEGSAGAIVELAHRAGDPRRGLFLRSLWIRERGTSRSLSAIASPLPTAPPSVPLPPLVACVETMPSPTPPKPVAPAVRRQPPTRPAGKPSPTPATAPPSPVVASTPEAPPFTVIAYLATAGRPRVTIKFSGEVKLVAPGDMVAGWRCVSIDRNEGAVFVSPSGARATLAPGADPR